MDAETRRGWTQIISGHPRVHQRSSARDAQASLEMTLALIGALLLLFGSLKVCLWVNERLIRRQIAYEEGDAGTGKGGRVAAGSSNSLVIWTEPSEPLRIFDE